MRISNTPVLGLAYRAARRAAKHVNFVIEYQRFRAASNGTPRFDMEWRDRWPFLNDRTETTGFNAHYVYHTSWAARVLARTKPSSHVDIGSDHRFATLVSAFVPIEFYDYRPAEIQLEGLTCGRANLTSLPFATGSVRSLSCMHVIEHVGLGRYGDPLDYDGDLAAMRELARVVAPGGDLLFVVPTGKARIQFNAHRIYSWKQVRDQFAAFDLLEFALVKDDGSFDTAATRKDSDAQLHGCGCFHFKKPA